MKNLKVIITGLILILFISSCSSKITFPVSTVTPAAQITATKKQDKQDNYKIKVTANHLASADRLTPPKKTYVLWLMTQDGLRNIGQLQVKNDKKTVLETITPFDPTEVILTAEDAANISYPSGTEISRATFK
jgi:PBP1b-binding outer membrane lipoprotein LpoB